MLNGDADREYENSDNSYDDDTGNKNLLMVAVLIVTVLIAGAWIMLLPFQLRKINSANERGVSDQWNEAKVQIEDIRNDFKERTDNIRQDFAGLESDYIIETNDVQQVEAGQVPIEIVRRLKAKLEELENSQTENEFSEKQEVNFE